MSLDMTKMPKLGFGLMRLPQKDGKIDLHTLCKMVDAYLERGFNYFDTAYVYHGGESERAVKEALTKRYPREAFTVATKLPAWAMNSAADRERIFAEQLERTGLDFIDFYLLHSLEDGDNYEKHERLGSFEWGQEMKKQGKIRHFGFSFHGSPDLLRTILARHPEVEFVQIQLNYIDWDNQVVHSGELYQILKEKNIPMIIMEPVKGGTLANLDDDFVEMMKETSPDRSVASWAMRFVGGLPGIATILSGMSNEEQMEDNLNTFAEFEPLSEAEQETLQKIIRKMNDLPLIGCTSCRYCTEGCPMGISIPDIFSAVNTARRFPTDMRPQFYYNNLTSKSARASECIGCGQCEGVCPQHLPIITLLKEAAEKFDKRRW